MDSQSKLFGVLHKSLRRIGNSVLTVVLLMQPGCMCGYSLEVVRFRPASWVVIGPVEVQHHETPFGKSVAFPLEVAPHSCHDGGKRG